MQRYDALLEEDPDGGWVSYEEAEQLLAECDAIIVNAEKRVLERDNDIQEWKSRFLKKEAIIGSLRSSLTATNDALKERIRISNQLFRDFESEQRHSDRINNRISALYGWMAVSISVNIALIIAIFSQIIGAYIGTNY